MAIHNPVTVCGQDAAGNVKAALVTADGEVWMTETERENNVHATVSGTQDTATTVWRGLIDLSDTTNWPHDQTGRIDISIIHFAADKAKTARGSVLLGVVTRIDGTDADVEFIAGISFVENDTPAIIETVVLGPTQLKCAVENGTLKFIKTANKETTASLNTGVTVDFNGESFTPAVGDIVYKLVTTTGGTLNWKIAAAYHSHA